MSLCVYVSWNCRDTCNNTLVVHEVWSSHQGGGVLFCGFFSDCVWRLTIDLFVFCLFVVFAFFITYTLFIIPVVSFARFPARLNANTHVSLTGFGRSVELVHRHRQIQYTPPHLGCVALRDQQYYFENVCVGNLTCTKSDLRNGISIKVLNDICGYLGSSDQHVRFNGLSFFEHTWVKMIEKTACERDEWAFIFVSPANKDDWL